MTCVVADDGSRGARAALALAHRLCPGEDRIVPVRVRERGAAVAEALVAVAEDEDASLIAVGAPTDERRRIVTSTVTDALLRMAPCPVLVVPAGFARELRTVGVAYDGRPESRRALVEAELLAERLDASLVIMQVAPEDELLEASRTLRRTAAGVRSRGLRAGSQLLTGATAPTLAAASDHVDLLVMGSRSHGPLRTVLLGSTARDLVDDARGPVLVTPRTALARPLSTVAA